jgi:c(7)-type cytochrome triheme protein
MNSYRLSINPLAVIACVFLSTGLLLVAQQKKAPDTLRFKAKNGEVSFNHAAHVKAAKDDCKACHPSQWPESATAPLNYKAALHRTAETKKTSCASCHHQGGASFTSKGNCAKCHAKK